MSVFLVILAIVAGIVLTASRQPDEFRVSRSALISAPPAAVFEHVNNLKKWQAWSPWVRMEPTATSTFEGPEAGVGAKLSWVGKKTGTGSMTIIDSTPSSFIRFRLEFLKPMKATNTTEFNFTPEDSGTRVTWSMYGPANLAGKVMNLLMNCEKMCNTQFDSGLANLGEVVGGSEPRKAA